MRGKMRHFAAGALVALLLLTPSAGATVRPAGPVTVRVGLNYGSAALPGANLDNNVGSGYRLGYFDANLNFVQLGYTSEGQISVVKAQNVSFVDGNYTDGSSGITVGCYHLQMPGTYYDFETAAAVARSFGGFPAWADGAYYARVGAYPSKEAAAAQGGYAGSTVVGTSSYGVSVVKTGTNTILFQFDGGAAGALGIQPGLNDTNKTATWFKGFRYYGAFRYQRLDGGNLTVVNIVPLEDYLKGVVPAEMDKDWPLEALKAQAVCARTYTGITMNKHGKYGFDLCNTTDCQAYKGLNVAGPLSDQAVDGTAGVYATYQGQLAQTYYYSHDGGATESVGNVWNESVPYLVGQKDPWEASVSATIPNYQWSVTFTAAELGEKLRAKGYACANIVDFYVSQRSPTGNVLSITFLDAAGKTFTFSNKSGESCRTLLGLRSINYSVSGGSGENTGAVVPPAGGSYFVNDGKTTIASVSGSYVVDGTGSVKQVTGTPYVITGSGTVEPVSPSTGGTAGGTGTVGSTGTGSGVYTVSGSGWGHLVGMSQWGANAMAKQGKGYTEILKFYFTGIDVG